MPTKKTWLLRIPEIREELAGVEAPVVDRAVIERVFHLGRRRAIQLMHYFDGYQAGRTFLIDRLALLRQLEPLEAGVEFALEKRRRELLSESLEAAHQHLAAARVALSVEPGAPARRIGELPAGVQLQPGTLRVDFHKTEDLLAKLFELSKAAASDFEAFRGAAEGN